MKSNSREESSVKPSSVVSSCSSSVELGQGTVPEKNHSEPSVAPLVPCKTSASARNLKETHMVTFRREFPA
jgi:hypothetical protein